MRNQAEIKFKLKGGELNASCEIIFCTSQYKQKIVSANTEKFSEDSGCS